VTAVEIYFVPPDNPYQRLRGTAVITLIMGSKDTDSFSEVNRKPRAFLSHFQKGRKPLADNGQRHMYPTAEILVFFSPSTNSNLAK
jgi:hypothetical protein